MEPTPEAVIADLQAKYDAALSRVMAVNTNLTERITASGLSVYYDPEDDLAVVVLGSVAPCVMLELDDTVLARLDPATDLIIGFDFPSARANRGYAPDIVRVMVDVILDLTADRPATFVALPAPRQPEIAKDLRELVYA